jgi:hypothetical protein
MNLQYNNTKERKWGRTIKYYSNKFQVDSFLSLMQTCMSFQISVSLTSHILSALKLLPFLLNQSNYSFHPHRRWHLNSFALSTLSNLRLILLQYLSRYAPLQELYILISSVCFKGQQLPTRLQVTHMHKLRFNLLTVTKMQN